jgi:hypothetical protein
MTMMDKEDLLLSLWKLRVENLGLNRVICILATKLI